MIRDPRQRLDLVNADAAADLRLPRDPAARLQLLAQAIDQAAEAVMVCDAEGRIVEVNQAFCAMTGFAPYEVVGCDPAHVCWEQDEVGRVEMEGALARLGHWKGVGRARRKDGTAYLEARSVSVARDAHGAPVSRVIVLSDVTREKEDERRLAHLAHHDALTGLPNRALFLHEAAEALARAHRHGARVALLYIDLDGFKQVNDTLGHAAGDAVLQAVGPRVQECVRKTDVVARLGGDEFTVVIEEVEDPRDVAGVARKILERLAAPVATAAGEVRVRGSIGIACYPDDAEELDALTAAADSAMYAAKAQGRNNFRYFAEDLNAGALESLIIGANLREALAREEFRLVFQPRVDLATLTVTGVEALVRWQHPELGLILPSRFIAAAEKSGLIEALDAWVLAAACRCMAAWRAAGHAPPRISINLSVREFRQPTLVERVAAALAHAGLDAGALELEVTESTIMADPPRAAVTLRRLRELGVTVAIDDFGTGFSSLNHLQRFQVDYLKIDESFVRAVPGESAEARMADAIMAIAGAMGVKLIAEGIETERQLDYLKRGGCGEGQGYYFSRPVAEAELAALLRG